MHVAVRRVQSKIADFDALNLPPVYRDMISKTLEGLILVCGVTGSGKTFTALCAMKDSFEREEVPLVLVPSDLLLRQWATELRSTFEPLGLRLLVCGGGHGDWREEGRLRAWTRPAPGAAPRAILSTLQTASQPEFLRLCRGGSHLFVIADEVHRLGAPQADVYPAGASLPLDEATRGDSKNR